MLDPLALRVYFGNAPVFGFSVLIYVGQTLALFYLFRRLGVQEAIGHAALLGIASYSGYELAFKLSFLPFGSDRVAYFMNYDLYPTALFIFGIAAVLAVRKRLNIRAFELSLIAWAVVWIVWLLSGNFPLDVQAYELNPTGLPLLFNFLTKLILSLAFVVGVRWSPTVAGVIA